MCPNLRDWEGERVPKIDAIWMLAYIKNSMQNRWFWKLKIKKIVKKKNSSKNHVFFACVFLLMLERFGEDFGKVLGEVWELLGVSWATFKALFSRLLSKEGPRESKRWPRGLLGSIWGGFGRVLGRFGSPKWKKLKFVVFFWICFFEISILVDYCWIFDNFDGGVGESKPVTGVCQGEEDRKASDICV